MADTGKVDARQWAGRSKEDLSADKGYQQEVKDHASIAESTKRYKESSKSGGEATHTGDDRLDQWLSSGGATAGGVNIVDQKVTRDKSGRVTKVETSLPIANVSYEQAYDSTSTSGLPTGTEINGVSDTTMYRGGTTGQWYADQWDAYMDTAQSNLMSYNQKTGNWEITVPKEIAETEAYQKNFANDATLGKVASIVAQNGADYKFADPQDSSKTITAEEYINRYADGLRELLNKGYSLHNYQKQLATNPSLNTDMVKSLNLDQMAMVADSDPKSEGYNGSIYLPKSWVEGNATSQLAKAVRESGKWDANTGFISQNDFKELYNLDNGVDRDDILTAMAQARSKLKQAWVKEKETDAPDKDYLDDYARSLSMLNYLQENDPDGSWWRKAALDAGATAEGIANGFTAATYALDSFFDNFGLLGQVAETGAEIAAGPAGIGMLASRIGAGVSGKTSQQMLEDLQKAQSWYTEGLGAVNDTAVGLNIIGELAGQVAADLIFSRGVTNVAEAATNVVGEALRATATATKVPATPYETAIRAAESSKGLFGSNKKALTDLATAVGQEVPEVYKLTTKEVGYVSKAVNFVLDTMSPQQASSFVNKAVKTAQMLNSPVVQKLSYGTRLTADFLTDTIIDAVISDPQNVRKVVTGDSTDGKTRDYLMMQIAQNAATMIVFHTGSKVLKGAGKLWNKTKLGRQINVRLSQLINKVGSSIGDKADNLKTAWNKGEDEFDKLARQASEAREAGKLRKASALEDKASILEQRRVLRAEQQKFASMSIAEDGLEAVERQQNVIRALNNSIDSYQRSISYKVAEYVNPDIHPTIAAYHSSIADARDAIIKAERKAGSGATIPTVNKYNGVTTILSQESSNYIGEAITIERAKDVIYRGSREGATVLEIEEAAKAKANLPIHQAAFADLENKLSPELRSALDSAIPEYKGFYKEYNGYLYSYDEEGIGLLNASQRAAYEANPDNYIRLQYAQEPSEWKIERADGKVANKTTSDIEHLDFGKRGDFVDPEITRFEYMIEKAQIERSANFAGIIFSAPGATKKTIVSGEETAKLYALKQGRKNATAAAKDYSRKFGENSDIRIRFAGENIKATAKPASLTGAQLNTARDNVISSLTGSDFESVLVSQGVPEGSFLKQLDNQTYGNLTDGEKQRAYELWRSQFDDQTNAWIDQTIAEYSAPGVPTPVAQAEADIEAGLLPKSAGEVVDITPNQYEIKADDLAWTNTANGQIPTKAINGQVGKYKGEGEWDGAKVFMGNDGAGLPSGYKVMANPSAAPSQEYVAIVNDKGEKALLQLPRSSEYDYERVGLATGTSRESLGMSDLTESSDIDYVYDSVIDADRMKKAKKEQAAFQKADDALYGRTSYDDFIKDQREAMWKSFKNSNRGIETNLVRDDMGSVIRRETTSYNGALYRDLYGGKGGRKPTKAQFNEAFDDVLENGENSRYYWMFREFDLNPDEEAIGKKVGEMMANDYNDGNVDIDDILLVKETTNGGKNYLQEPDVMETQPMGFVSFQQARANLGDDFEDALNRTYLMHNKEFRESELMNGLVENQLAGQRAAEKYILTDSVESNIASVNGINHKATAEGFVADFNDAIDATVNNMMVEKDFENTIQLMAQAEPGSSVDDIREYVMLSEMRGQANRKIAYASIDDGIDAEIKGKNVSTDDAAKLKKVAHDTYDDVLDNKYNDVRTRLSDSGSQLVDQDEWYDEVRRLDDKIKQADKAAKTSGDSTILMMDEKGRATYVQVDPAVAELYKYRPGLNQNDMSVIARFNFNLSKVFRFGTTTANLKSMVNQGFRDTGNATIVGGAWSTIKSSSKYFADTFGDEVADALGDFESREVRILAQSQGVDIATAAARREAAIGAALSPASTEASLYAEAVKGVHQAKQGKATANSILDQTKNKTKSIIDKIDGFTNGAREEYLRKRVYVNSLNEAMGRGLSIKQARQYAQFAMNNATTNFSRSLYHLNNFASSVPYLKAAINGSKSFWRMWSLDPMAITSRIMGGVVLPVWYLVGQSLGDPENRKVYENLPEYQKTNRIPFVVGGEYFSIPIPQELSTLVDPARHFVEYLNGAQPNAFQELMLNDLLGFAPLDVQGFALLDQNTMLNDPTMLDRLDQGFSQLFSQVAPIPVKSTYMALTGKDPYTGRVLRDQTKTYYDEESGEWVLQTNTQSEFTNLIDEQFPGMNSGILNKVLSGVFGQTGMDVLDSIVAAATGKSQSFGVGELLTKQGSAAGKAITSEVYDKINSDWYDAVKTMQDKKAAIMSNPAVVKINEKLASETNESKRRELLAQRANYTDPYTEEVAQMVTNLKEKYGGSFDRYRFSSVIQLLNFGTDANWYQGNAYAKNEGQSASLTGWKTAVNTAYNAGVPNVDDYSIFGYVRQNYETGEPEIKYTTPTGILDARNSVWTQNSVNMSSVKSALESNTFTGDQTIGQKMQTEYWNKYNKLKSNDYDGKDKLSKEWNNKVWNAIAPALANMTVDEATNNADLINYLEKYIRVPSEYQKVKGRYVSSGYDAETGTTQLDKNAAFIKSYVREMMKAMKGEK